MSYNTVLDKIMLSMDYFSPADRCTPWVTDYHWSKKEWLEV
jgi:hypothetical protein